MKHFHISGGFVCKTVDVNDCKKKSNATQITIFTTNFTPVNLSNYH